ncbi:MAG: 50S ribosomal protein L30 [Armatimonadota bacterium]|nr:50S ribosomal protein L30 [Armatimonadota bacterium]
MSKLKVTLVRSPIGLESSQRRTCESLGLWKMRRSRVHNDTPMIRGMLRKVRHLVAVVNVEEEASANS